MYIINGVIIDFKELWKLVSKDRFPKLEDFAIKICLEIYTFENTFSTINQVKCKNRNRMAGETLFDSLRLSIGIDKGTIVSEKPRSQASH